MMAMSTARTAANAANAHFSRLLTVIVVDKAVVVRGIRHLGYYV